MPDIQVLSPHVADLIAAGEVVERPASAAKELCENAIDAGARKITVEIQRGGMLLLRVTDDGCGIPADQLKTAFLRHATSKLRTAQDLEAIGSLGFRGEALAALSAVSRMSVLTRTEDSEIGAYLELEGGMPGEVQEAGCPRGTAMTVRDLFFNTPARQKFMKKDSAEGAAVFAAVQQIALSHPEVSVRFIRDGRQDLLTPGDGSLKSAVYAVLGRDLALGMTEVESDWNGNAVSGFVSLPVCCRGSRSLQYFFVNGRCIRSRMLTAAVEEAYRNQKMVGKFPACVLHISTLLNTVDVNVHPAKTEIRFGSEREIFSLVHHAVLDSLTRSSGGTVSVLEDTPVPGMEPPQDLPQVTLGDLAAQQDTPPEEHTAGGPVFPAPSGLFDGLLQEGGTLQPPESGQDTVPEGAAPPPSLSESSETAPLPRNGSLESDSAPGTQKPASPAQVRSSTVSESPASGPSRRADTPENPERSPFPPEPGDRDWRLAGEVLNTYIIVEQGDSVFFIDKHAAHERINFDRMKAEDYVPMSQILLSPVLCRLSQEEMDILLSSQSLLEQYGFDVDELAGELAVRRAPCDVEAGDIPAALEEIARSLLTTGTADPAAARDSLLRTMACRAAIKGGWKTSPRELEKVAEAVMSGQVKYCPHGRPVSVCITRRDLEKKFRRT